MVPIHPDMLPPPPTGKTGWPWTEAAQPLPPARVDGSPWPRITIVTPSYNQGQFIEETIRSILLQGYPNLEYMIIDGGSSDQSVEIIRKYEPWLSFWVSKKDRGQAHAINGGLARATGEIFQWINSDDVLDPQALRHIGEITQAHDCIAGRVTDFYETGIGSSKDNRGLTALDLIRGVKDYPYHQPGVWLRTDHARATGELDEAFHLGFDAEFTIRYLERWPRVLNIDCDLVRFRVHNASKSVTIGHEFGNEHLRILERLPDKLQTPALRRKCENVRGALLWQAQVNLIRRNGLPKHVRLSKLSRAILCDPLRRLDRPTLGAARAIIAED